MRGASSVPAKNTKGLRSHATCQEVFYSQSTPDSPRECDDGADGAGAGPVRLAHRAGGLLRSRIARWPYDGFPRCEALSKQIRTIATLFLAWLFRPDLLGPGQVYVGQT